MYFRTRSKLCPDIQTSTTSSGSSADRRCTRTPWSRTSVTGSTWRKSIKIILAMFSFPKLISANSNRFPIRKFLKNNNGKATSPTNLKSIKKINAQKSRQDLLRTIKKIKTRMWGNMSSLFLSRCVWKESYCTSDLLFYRFVFNQSSM